MSDTVKQSEKRIVDGVIYTGGQKLPEQKKAAVKQPDVKKSETSK